LRIRIRTSKWAIWAQRLGSVAVPLLVLPILMHRQLYIDSNLFLVLIILAGIVAALTALVALAALVRLWFSGDQGWGRALGGLVLGLICLTPFAIYGAQAWRYPAVTDIATASRADLPLIFEPDTAIMPPARLLPANEQRRIFPNAETRGYPLDVMQLFALVERLVQAEGWDMRRRIEPRNVLGEGRINARVMTLPGWQDEVVLAVRPTAQGGQVDMRSASIGAPIDFGSNGTRISAFLSALDNEVTVLLRDNPTLNEPLPAEEAAPEVDTGNGS